MYLQLTIVLGVIVVLGAMNVGAMIWVSRLQKKLRALTDRPHFQLSENQQADLNQQAYDQFKKVVAAASQKVDGELGGAAGRINSQLEAVVNQFLQAQLEQYSTLVKQSLDKVGQSLAQVEAAAEKQRQTLTEGLDKDIAAEKSRRLEQFEQKMSDVVAAYLVEALGNNVDLGAQSQFFFKVLDEHKAELRKDLMDEV